MSCFALLLQHYAAVSCDRAYRYIAFRRAIASVGLETIKVSCVTSRRHVIRKHYDGLHIFALPARMYVRLSLARRVAALLDAIRTSTTKVDLCDRFLFSNAIVEQTELRARRIPAYQLR